MPKGNYTSNGGWSTKWTREELNILKQYYPIGGVDKVQKLLPNTEFHRKCTGLNSSPIVD